MHHIYYQKANFKYYVLKVKRRTNAYAFFNSAYFHVINLLSFSYRKFKKKKAIALFLLSQITPKKKDFNKHKIS